MMLLPLLSLLAAQPVAAERCASLSGPAAVECGAQVAVAEDRHADAAAIFEKGAEAKVGEIRARMLAAAGVLWAAAERHEAAVSAFDRALAADALSEVQTGFTIVDRANSLHALGRGDEALTDMDRAAANVGEDPYLWYSAARVALEIGRLDEAEARLARGLSLAADSPELLHLKGRIAQARGDAPAARAAYREAIFANPRHAAAQAAGRDLQALGPDDSEAAQ